MTEKDWIKVKDKLPLPNTFVLTFGKIYGMVVGYIGNEGKWYAEYTDFESGEPYLSDAGTVTHWRSLPKEPE